ncbi:hypothetical protein BJY52DRAFT_143166 [Lactarius psammicola]|nr:hypothetical protein BJY52DRAFT_143166 [Lactarius psammicola]
MHLFLRFVLWVLHFLYSVYLALSSIRSRWFQSAPRSLTATRSKIPSHLALVLASQEPEFCVFRSTGNITGMHGESGGILSSSGYPLPFGLRPSRYFTQCI